MAQHPAAIQTASDVYASQGYTGHGYADQQVAQPSPRTTFTFRDPLPLSTGRINDFTITGPNSQPQPIKAAIDTTYEVSFLAASAANESGCVWEKLPPVPHAIQGPASLFDPCYWVLGVRVDSEFFGIQGMEVDLYLLPDNLFTPGVRIIIGQSMMEMMEMIKRQRRGRNSSTQQVPNSVRGG
ncbi:Fc.00g039800.m01.CDS01 [Cosmosporella sp. VM-42]